MTEINESELAEYWIRRLPEWKHKSGHWIPPSPIAGIVHFDDDLDQLVEEMFYGDLASVFAHLIQSYMEGEGFGWIIEALPDKPFFARYFPKEEACDSNSGKCCLNKNSWISNAEAARKALEGI